MKLIAFFAGVGLSASLAGASFTPVTSTFDTGFDGWTTGGPATVHQSTGGNPGGFVEYTRSFGSLSGSLTAPSTFHGDWMSLGSDGELGFDLLVSNILLGVARVEIFVANTSAGGGSARWQGDFSTLTDWIGVSVSLSDSSEWAQVSPLGLDAVLSNVTNVTIQFTSGSESAWEGGIDNVRVVPSPSAATVGLILAAIGTSRRRR